MEIERKFLVNKEKWEVTPKPPGIRIVQGYLSTDPEKSIRVRIYGDKAYMTVKGKPQGIAREEIEFEIPLEKARELLNKFCGALIEKDRYRIEFAAKIWEVDLFEGDNKGLILAEIELSFEDEQFVLPPWAEQEVTNDIRYYNSYLSENPYLNWEKPLNHVEN